MTENNTRLPNVYINCLHGNVNFRYYL